MIKIRVNQPVLTKCSSCDKILKQGQVADIKDQNVICPSCKKVFEVWYFRGLTSQKLTQLGQIAQEAQGA